MKEFAKIKCTIWASKKFGSVNEKHKLFYLYLHTNSRVNSCGCYFSPVGYMMHDLGWNQTEVEEALYECEEAGLIRYWKDEDTVLIENFFSVNSPQNPKHAIKLLSDIEAIPYRPFKKVCALELKRFLENSGWKIEQDFLYRIERVSTLDLDVDVDRDVDNNPPTPQGGGEKVEEKKAVKKTNDEPPIEVPEFIEGDLWLKWIQHRKEIRKKLTRTQAEAQIKKLTKWKEQGYDPNEIIRNSISNGWQGLFEPKPGDNGSAKPGTAEYNRDRLQSWVDS